jgi:antitoxin CptB
MTEPAQPPRDARRRRLLYRATHRGTQETDLLVGGYVAARIDAFSDADLDALDAILDLPDPDLANWLTGREDIPPEADSAMLRAMRDAAGAP